jgi:hypothetical protein
MADQNGSLSLDDVRTRFAESEEVLQLIRGRLAGLADAQVGALASAESLREASAVVASFGTQAASLLEELASTQRDARAALEATARFLDGSELTAIRESIEALRADIGHRLDEGEAELERTQHALSRREKRRLGI